MISHKFSGHLNSNLFVRVDREIFVTQLWSSSLVALIEKEFSDAGLQKIKGHLSWDECLNYLLKIGAIYLDQKRIHSDVEIDSLQVLRIHLMPKRYDVKRFDEKSSVVFENSEFIVINKPSQLPVHPMLDNDQENILNQLQKNRQEKIYAVHRLDIETSGLLIFAKNEKSMSHWQSVFTSAKSERVSDRKIVKEYRAVTSPFDSAMGLYQHWMVRSPKSPKHILDVADENSDLVQLNVLRVNSFKKSKYSQVDLELLTGKTHQIRAQLSHLGSPLVADALYGGEPFPSGLSYPHFLLHAFRMRVLGPDQKIHQLECLPEWGNG